MPDEPYYSGRPLVFGSLAGRHAIIIPCYNELGVLGEHLNALALQDTHDFDAIIVASDVLDMEGASRAAASRPFGITIIRRGSDTGSAGGFYAGQRYAMEKGYSCMVFADVDAIPIGKSAVRTLLLEFESGSDLVLSGARLFFEGEPVFESKPAVLPFYGLISARLVEKAGYVFAPAYNGAEDNDYLQRLSRLCRPSASANWVRHPVITPFFSKSFDRDGRYIVNQLVLLPGGRLLGYHFFTTALLAPAFIFFGKPYARELAAFVLWNALLGRYGKVLSGFQTSQRLDVRKIDCREFDLIITVLKGWRGRERTLFIDAPPGPLEKAISPARVAFRAFRKKTLLRITNQLSIPAVMAFGREAWIFSRDDTAYQISDNRGRMIHLLRLLAFFASLPIFLAFSLFLLALRLIGKPDTRGFGLAPRKH